MSMSDALGVIFDMDGVLVASGPAHSASWKLVAKKHGIRMDDAIFKASFGMRSRDIIRSLWGDGISDEQVRAIDDEKEASYRQMFGTLVPLTIGTREMLGGLAQSGFRLAVATSGPRENIELVVRDKKLETVFQAIVTGADVKNGKPAPDCFLLAAERIGVAAGRAVVVEDAPVGIEAAKAAGMRCIGFVGTHPAERLRAAGCDEVAEKMADLTPALIRKMLLSTA